MAQLIHYRRIDRDHEEIRFEWEGAPRRIEFFGVPDLNQQLTALGVGEFTRGIIVGDMLRARREGWAA